MLVPVGSNNSAVCRQESVENFRGMKGIPTEEYSPEKAGVGGSIPSLATTKSIAYTPTEPLVCSILFQFLKSRLAEI